MLTTYCETGIVRIRVGLFNEILRFVRALCIILYGVSYCFILNVKSRYTHTHSHTWRSPSPPPPRRRTQHRHTHTYTYTHHIAKHMAPRRRNSSSVYGTHIAHRTAVGAGTNFFLIKTTVLVLQYY